MNKLVCMALEIGEREGLGEQISDHVFRGDMGDGDGAPLLLLSHIDNDQPDQCAWMQHAELGCKS